jgi:prevent-host-death family protein
MSSLNVSTSRDTVVISDYFLFRSDPMSTFSLKDAKAGFSSLIDDAIRGEFVTITRHGKPVAALVSVAAGHNPGMADAVIAGIAEAHDLTVITRNVKHFRPFDIRVASPDDAAIGAV